MIYVDDLRAWPENSYRNENVRRLGAVHKHLWCHLITDGTDEELHKFAERIGMKRAWAQRGKHGVLHYDLVPPRRAAAVRLGAKQVTRKQLVELVLARGSAQRKAGFVQLRNWAPPWNGVPKPKREDWDAPADVSGIDAEDAWYAYRDHAPPDEPPWYDFNPEEVDDDR